MGVLDVKIEIECGSRWMGRNQRLERLRTIAAPNSEPADQNPSSATNPSIHISEQPTYPTLAEEHGEDKHMNLELYKAATKDDVDGFIDVLERVSTEKALPLPAIFDQVSPLENTLLHVAASFGNEENVRLIAYHCPSLLMKRNSKGDTALHVAAKAGHIQTLATLIRLRSDYVYICPFSPCSDNSDNGGEAINEVVWDDDDLLLRIRNEKGNTALHEALINKQRWEAWSLIYQDPKVSYYLNNEGKSPLYLAIEAGLSECVDKILGNEIGNENPDERLKGKSPIHAAIMGRKRGVLDIMLNTEPRFIHLRDEEGRTPLHCAASIGYLEGVCYLLGKYTHGALERDNNGFFPVHLASIKGHIDVIQELLQHCSDPRELLEHNGQNILHVAAKSGKHNVVSYILKTPELEKLINETDEEGNTPLHLATMHWHPKIVSTLTWDKRVDLKLVNNEGLTALDVAEYYMERTAPFRKRLTWTALRAAGVPRASSDKVLNASRQASMRSEPPNMDNYKDRVNTLLLVSTLVATVTFAAGFTMPGGYNNSEPDQGMATMLRHKKFQVFIFCDTIAMYSSILVAVTLIWAQLGDLNLVLTALRLALPLLGIALTMMSLAFMAGVYLVVSKLSWLANAVLIMGLVFLVTLSVLFFPLCFPVSSSYRILRYISYYPFCLLLLATGSYTNDNME